MGLSIYMSVRTYRTAYLPRMFHVQWWKHCYSASSHLLDTCCMIVISEDLFHHKDFKEVWRKPKNTWRGLKSQYSLVAQAVKNPPAIWETWLQSLGREEPLEKEMATHSSILAWRIPWAEEPGGLPSMGLQRVGQDWVTFPFTFKRNTH